MCGITGFFNYFSQDSEHILDRMTATLVTRGPDSQGIWLDPQAGIGFGHRRLAIIDLSPEGHQPMTSASGRYVITFNGEIYNYQQIKADLTSIGHKFRGGSDTEVMLAAFETWGIADAVTKFVGMFAFGLWDKQERVLYLGRDRLGEKPLYYGWLGDAFVFASELKAFKQHPDWKGEIDRNALALSMRHNCIPSPYSIYQDINKLPPGTILTLDNPKSKPTPIPYWSAKTVAEFGAAHPLNCPDNEAIDRLDSLLQAAVKSQMVSDVPLGAFLSGGIDSSTIVALMQAQSSQPVKTFTIGFDETEYNEAVHAKEIANHLGTEHTELYVTAAQALDVIPNLPQLYDEPFADSSQIPTFLVSQLARQHVTVSLSGDAGDELFGGYNRYLWAPNIWQKFGKIPPAIRQMAAKLITSQSPATWNQQFANLGSVLPKKLTVAAPGEKLHKLAQVLGVPDRESMYVGLTSHWQETTSLVLGSVESETLINNRQSWAKVPEFAEQMMYLDMMTYLPDDILVKVDRASMGVSLESRVPFLDHRVVEFAWQLPLAMKIRDGQSKWILRQVLDKYVPQSLIERPKMGFGVPIDRWLRTSLKDWAENLLDENRLRQAGFFDPKPIRKKWAEHLSGKFNWQHHLWDILMFQAWLENEL
jgi:asparagine synthase (glutamine-hydrolysing)